MTERILEGLTFSTSCPGGFKDCTLNLPRGIYPSADEALLDTLTILGPGNRIVWEGRLTAFPRETGDRNAVHPQAVGFAQHLSDDKSFQAVYVDRDLGSWQAMPLNRRVLLAGGRTLDQDYTFAADTGSLRFDGGTGKSIAISSETEAWYTMPPGLKVAVLGYRGTESNTTSVEAARIYTDDNDAMSSLANVALTLDDTLREAAIVTAERYAMLEARATATHTPAAGSPFNRTYKKLAVYGNHGLTRRTITGEPSGLYVSDMIVDILTRAAPLLAFTAGGTIQATTFPVPHAAFREPTTAADAIATLNAYHVWDWMVWENRTFYYQPPATGTQWRARRSDGARLRLDGDSADAILNELYVRYTEAGTDRQRVAGPTGSAYADVTSDMLKDASVDNPFNRAGVPHKNDILDLSVATTDEGAVQIGAMHLAERNIATRRGQLTVTGSIEHPTEGKVPVWRVRAGDTVVIGDIAGDTPRRIIETSYDRSTNTNTLTLDNTSSKLEAIIERVAVSSGFLT